MPAGRGPAIALAMMDGMAHYVLRPHHLDELDRIGEVIDPVPLSDLEGPRAARVLAHAEVLVGHWGCPTLTAAALDLAPRLRLFAYAAGTVKWQVTDAVWDRGIVVTSAAAANAVPVAEFTVAAILFANKGVPWFSALERDPSLQISVDPTCIGNYGRRIGLVGASHVGRHTITLLAPHDLEVAVADPFLDDADASSLGVARMDLDELCSWCDVLSLHAPDVPATRRMIGAPQLARLRDGATLINTARGALVDHDALLPELQDGRINAILDVTEPEPLPANSPLRRLPNVMLTPHLAGATGDEVVRLTDLAVEEVRRFADGEPPLHPVLAEELDRLA